MLACPSRLLFCRLLRHNLFLNFHDEIRQLPDAPPRAILVHQTSLFQGTQAALEMLDTVDDFDYPVAFQVHVIFEPTTPLLGALAPILLREPPLNMRQNRSAMSRR